MCVPCHTGDESVAPEAQQRMLEVCRQVITRAAQDTWQQTDGHSQHAGAAHHVTDGTSWEQVICPAIWTLYIAPSSLLQVHGAASCRTTWVSNATYVASATSTLCVDQRRVMSCNQASHASGSCSVLPVANFCNHSQSMVYLCTGCMAAQQVLPGPQVKMLVSAMQQEILRLGIMYAGYQGTLDSDSVGELLQHSQ